MAVTAPIFESTHTKIAREIQQTPYSGLVLTGAVHCSCAHRPEIVNEISSM